MCSCANFEVEPAPVDIRFRDFRTRTIFVKLAISTWIIDYLSSKTTEVPRDGVLEVVLVYMAREGRCSHQHRTLIYKEFIASSWPHYSFPSFSLWCPLSGLSPHTKQRRRQHSTTKIVPSSHSKVSRHHNRRVLLLLLGLLQSFRKLSPHLYQFQVSAIYQLHPGQSAQVTRSQLRVLEQALLTFISFWLRLPLYLVFSLSR